VYTKVKNTAVIYQGFSFGAIKDEPLRRTVLNNYLSFLMKVTDVEPADINVARLSAYPLPAAQMMNVTFLENASPGTLRVADTRGREWMTLPVSAGAGSMRLDMSSLPAGSYYLLLERAGAMSACAVMVGR
jgi:hypothetical protein